MKKLFLIFPLLSLISNPVLAEQYRTPEITMITITGTGNTYSAWTEDALSRNVAMVSYKNVTISTDNSISLNAIVHIACVPLPNTYTAGCGYDSIAPSSGFPDEFVSPCKTQSLTGSKFYFNLTSGAKAMICRKTWRLL